MSTRATREPAGNTADAIQYVRDILDHPIVDAHQVPCGMVDDVEFELVPSRGLRPVALLVGPGAWQRRLTPWIAALARLAIGGAEVRIPFSEVAYIDERVALRATAEELGLHDSERKWSARLARAFLA
jgi:hypothetical protein